MMKIHKPAKYILSITLLILFGVAACGSPKEPAPEADENAIFMDGPGHPAAGAAIPGAPADSPVSPVLETPPTPHEPALPQTRLLVKIQNNRSDLNPGPYAFLPQIQGGAAPYQVHWSCTSATQTCPSLSTQGLGNGLPQAQGNFTTGRYQIDLSVLDDRGQRASDTLVLEIANPTTGGIHQNEGLRNFDPQVAFPAGPNPSLSQGAGTAITGNRNINLEFNNIYGSDPIRGLANIQVLTEASSLTLHRSILQTDPEANRLEGNIRMRFPRHRITTYPEGPGVFQTPVTDEYFPVHWISLSFRACTISGSCRTLIQEIPFDEDENLACNAETNSDAFCEGDFTIKVLAQEISGVPLEELENFEIRISDTHAALLELGDNQYQVCQATTDCPGTHPNCVGGLCSAIQPGELLAARRSGGE